MKFIYSIFLFFQFSAFNLHGSYNDFDDNPLISEDFKQRMEEFILPEDHPCKPYMDILFQNRTVLKNFENFKLAGFQTLYRQKRTKIKVAKHKLIPGYLVKVVLDDELELKGNIPEWFWFTQRCIGAKKIRNSIESHGFTLFSVPKKWIYPLPWRNAPMGRGYLPKAIILLVEDMNLYDHADSKIAWEVKITKEHLEELYVILKEAGGASYRTDNICYSLSEQFAFIDTEYPDTTADLSRIKKHLSKEMALYWQALIDSGGQITQEEIHIPNKGNPINPLFFCVETKLPIDHTLD